MQSTFWGWVRRFSFVVAVACLAGCGGGGGGGGAGSAPVDPVPAPGSGIAATRYFPLTVADRWGYGDGSITRVVGTQAVSGGTAFLLRTEEASGSSESLYLTTATGVTALPADSASDFERAIGRFDLLRFPLVAGSSFVAIDKTLTDALDADRDGRNDVLTVHAEVTLIGFERVVTPAGSFDNALHARTVVTQSITLSSNGARTTLTLTSDDWYAPDVGPVRNVSSTVGTGVDEHSEQLRQVFKVGALRSEQVAPSLLSRSPADGSVGRVATVRASFSEAMERSTLAAAGLRLTGPDGQAVAGRIVWDDDRNLSFVADGALAMGSYTVSLAGGLEDLAGNPLATTGWRFSIDTAGPKLTASYPVADAIEVPLDAAITLSFDEAPDPASITPGNVWIEEFGLRIAASLRVDGRVVTLTPARPLAQSATYQVWISGFVTDTLGNPIGATTSLRFKADPGRFAAPLVLPALGVPTAVELADVDGDGRLDVVAAEGSADDGRRVLLLRRQADGALPATPEVLATLTGCTPVALAVTDVDGDGLLDVVVSEFGCGVEVIRQTSRGVWARQGLMTTLNAYAVRSVPIAGQQRPALVAGVFGKLLLWRPAAGGGFAAPVELYSIGYSVNDIEVADINGDGRPDIVASAALDVGVGLVIASQRSDGGFDLSTVPFDNADAGTLAIGDVDGDGRLDVVTLRPYPPSGPSVAVMRQTAAGTLAPATFIRTQPNPTAVRIGDIDGDGRADIVVAHSGYSQVSVYRQGPGGSLAAEELFDSPGIDIGRALAIGDLTGDGRSDLLVKNTLLRQRAGVATPSGSRRPGAAQAAALRQAAAAARR